MTNVLQVVDIEIFFYHVLKYIYCGGDTEINLGSKQSSLTFWHWNLDAIAAHELIIISLLQGYITERRKIDMRKINLGVPIP